MKKQVVSSLLTMALIATVSITPGFASTPDKSSASKELHFTPGGHEGQEGVILPSTSVSQADDSYDTFVATAASLPYTFSFNEVGTGRWSSSHFDVTKQSFEVAASAYVKKGSATSDKKYYIQAFRDTFWSSTALGTYNYPYATSESGASTQYGQWKSVGPGEYNIEVYSDGPWLNGSGNITEYTN
ncbi:hypothetical protein P4H65_12165 [Paenibacillus chitinolyticus]|uniref:hypothetical protein n=1 Tax=Paenibacillus chitinolyticus TaxID=79263 RepID=UPI002DBD587D|nr:hypothetical protein [Paenibacillus chitinolyticus]MEC0246543.1 hypothetical protein [Paenibacillus chitinolyticus]